MRARAGLADALWALGREDEALEHMWELLRLNPNDNQGTRDVLLPRLLARHDHAGAHRLLALFAEDGMAIFAFGHALLIFQEQGETASADAALETAIRANEFVSPYLLGLRRLPRQLPTTMGLGDEDEGVICAAEHLDAWASTDGALAWLGRRWQGTASAALQGRVRKVLRSRQVRPGPQQ
jgi:tetratricopeptide (TPR) repeat protein